MIKLIASKQNPKFKASCSAEFHIGGHIIFDAVSYQQGVRSETKSLFRDNDAAHRSNPSYFPVNYGGHYVDLGLGLNVHIPTCAFAGNSAGFEWLQPVFANVNGYQLDR